jgi:hypothetical protein
LKRFKKLGEWLNQMWDHVYSITPVSSRNVRVNRTTRGTSYVGVAQGEEAEPGGMQWKGEYNPLETYEEQDVVVIRGGGPSSGAYVANKHVPVGNPPSYPDVGEYWVSLRGPEVTYWT